MENAIHIPAYVWVGSHTDLVIKTELYLMGLWCKYGGCKICATCKAVKAHHFYLLSWVTPEKQQYTVAQVDEIMHLLSFARDPGERFYIVFEYAQLLSMNSAAMLLKVLEEPPPGYFFILLSESLEELLPTIVSRCVVEQIGSTSADEKWDSFLLLFHKGHLNIAAYARFEKENNIPLEYEARKLVETLSMYWLEEYRSCEQEHNASQAQHVFKMLRLLEDALRSLPMPGSSKLFWRTLFLKMAALTSA